MPKNVLYFCNTKYFQLYTYKKKKIVLIEIFNSNVQLDKIDTNISNHKLKNIEGKIQVNINFNGEIKWTGKL